MASSELRLQQLVIFGVLFWGYGLYIFDRKAYAFNIPNIKLTEQVASEAIGSVISSFAIGYAIGKFVCGILVDSFSPRYLFSAGLVICGGINLVFSVTSSTSAHSALWFANGLAQGLGWPSCAKLLRSWYSPNIFGTLWSLLSASMNLAASIGPLVCNKLVDKYGSWRYSMRIFGVLSLLSAVLSLIILRDKPKDSNKVSHDGGNGQDSKRTTSKSSFKSSILLILSSPFIYVMSYGFLAVLICKGVVSDWGPLYLISNKNATRTQSSTFIGLMEVGGLIGSITSGIVTDWITSRSSEKETGHPRNIYIIPCIATLVTCLIALRTYINDVQVQYTEALVLAFIIGFALYGLISTVGVMTIEKSAKDISGTSHAVAALFGNVGLTISGLPFTMVVETYSWETGLFLVECALIFWAAVASFSEFIVCRIGDVKSKTD